jgi:hypothetical protein
MEFIASLPGSARRITRGEIDASLLAYLPNVHLQLILPALTVTLRG